MARTADWMDALAKAAEDARPLMYRFIPHPDASSFRVLCAGCGHDFKRAIASRVLGEAERIGRLAEAIDAFTQHEGLQCPNGAR